MNALSGIRALSFSKGKLPINVALKLILFKGVVLVDGVVLGRHVVGLLLCLQCFIESNLPSCP